MGCPRTSYVSPPHSPGCDLDDGDEVRNDGSETKASDASSREIKLLMHEVHVLSHN